jgi:hypothetical protein
VADIRVVAQAAPGMTLQVDGFDAAEPTTDANGQRMLFTTKQMQKGDAQMPELSVTLSGLPTPGAGQWVAVALAAALAGFGMISARRAPAQPQRLAREDVESAQEILLDELVRLERARQSQQIGPSTYETARRRLVDALARLQDGSAGGAGRTRAAGTVEPSLSASSS